jgi:hypothetical protein
MDSLPDNNSLRTSVTIVIAAIINHDHVVPSGKIQDFMHVTHLVESTCSIAKSLVAMMLPSVMWNTLKRHHKVVPVPNTLPRQVGTIRIKMYSTATEHVGKSWIWDSKTNAVPITTPIAFYVNRGSIQHYYHTTEKLAPICHLCFTQHTTGKRICHGCIMAEHLRPHQNARIEL